MGNYNHLTVQKLIDLLAFLKHKRHDARKRTDRLMFKRDANG